MRNISITNFQKVLAKESNNAQIAFIDVCTPSEHQAKHILGVKNIPLDELPSRINELAEKKTIYLHCRSGNRSKRAIEILQQQGVKSELINVDGGIMAWESAGLHTEKSQAKLPITQQVFILAGLCIISGVLLTIIFGKIFLVIPAFVGGGLFFAGITGWCGMALLLSKMPWNK